MHAFDYHAGTIIVVAHLSGCRTQVSNGYIIGSDQVGLEELSGSQRSVSDLRH